MPQDGEVVSIHYIGLLEDGIEFDNSYSRNEPFVALSPMVIPGWEEAMRPDACRKSPRHHSPGYGL